MSLITAVNLAKAYGQQDVFEGVSFSIPPRARIGLVGANGVGKTTLLRIVAGLEEPSTGTLQRARGVPVGYLPQEAALESSRTLWQECLSVFGDLLNIQHELSDLEAVMADQQQAAAALERYGRLQAVFEHRGGYTYEAHLRQTLSGLGFSQPDYHRPVTQLSGGQRTRALLARLLLSQPGLMLLDEPTNHLDLSAIEWLENYLRDWEGAALIVSHDRYFLDQVVDVIWDMTPALEIYRGNYSAYTQQRNERTLRRQEEFQTQQAFIEKEEEYIRRNISGQNTRQAQGRRKRLERMLDESPLTAPVAARRMHLKLNPAARSGDLVLRTRTLSIGYADEGRPLFNVPDLILKRGECAAILGPNGAGKTTLLKTLLGQTPPYSGEAELGASLHIGYFAQAHEDLHPERTLMEEIDAAAPNQLPAEARSYLAKFLFTDDDVFKQVKTLSGGERGRLALARLALQGANLLLLDEPTNHLDLLAQDGLQAILAEFPGTILLVSHDRYLIDALATQIWEVLPDESALRVFKGSYSEYRAVRQSEAPVPPVKDISPPAATRKKPETMSKAEQRKRQQRLALLEDR
ncbi:MAG: ABC-F family ATP-binding cassette domain-containing protein, partial [Anaerolineaceae bacterium]|nr:ABC-F family ATP-binding cassette domain-containing protein [Anaerolineaceae bacterium]